MVRQHERVLPANILSRQTRQQPAQKTVLVLDCSVTMDNGDFPPTRFGAAKSSGLEFMWARAKQSIQDAIAIVSYGSQARRECDWTVIDGNLKMLEDAINRIEIAGMTAIGEGLLEAEKLLLGGRKAPLSTFLNWFTDEDNSTPTNVLERIILLTDGDHNHGTDPLPIANRLKQAGVQIDCIGIGGCPEDVKETRLRELASLDHTTRQPRYRFITDKEDLTEHFRQLATGITR